MLVTLEDSGDFLHRLADLASMVQLDQLQLISYLSSAVTAQVHDRLPEVFLTNARLPCEVNRQIAEQLQDLIESLLAATSSIHGLMSSLNLIKVIDNDESALIEIDLPGEDAGSIS